MKFIEIDYEKGFGGLTDWIHTDSVRNSEEVLEAWRKTSGDAKNVTAATSTPRVLVAKHIATGVIEYAEMHYFWDEPVSDDCYELSEGWEWVTFELDPETMKRLPEPES